MVVDSGKIVLALVFICGILAGVVVTGILTSQPAPPVKQVVFTDRAPRPVGPYSHALQSGDYVFLSGQIGIDPATQNLSGSVEEQTRQAMENLRAVLQESGLGFEDVIQTRIYFLNISDWATINEVYGSNFTGRYPARATVQVAGLPKGALVEIEMLAGKR